MPSGATTRHTTRGMRAGRNGVAVLTRHAPVAVRTLHPAGYDRPVARELRDFAADQGRYIEVDLADRPLTVAECLRPQGRVAGAPAEAGDGCGRRPTAGAAYDRKMRFAAGLSRHLDRSRRVAAPLRDASSS
jgi:exodeoxyribonuclease-3